MNKMNVIDLEGVNCWQFNLKPNFNGLNENDRKIFQCSCIENRVFGIGWNIKKNVFDSFVELNDKTYKKYIEEYKKYKKNKKDEVIKIKSPLSDMMSINVNDYVVMRLSNAKYYIGRVSKRATYNFDCKIDNFNDHCRGSISWYCEVNEWRQFSEQEMPSEIVGRLSQSKQSTITRIDPYRQIILIKKAYEEYNNKKSNLPKVVLTKYNFTRSLKYWELEDLVSKYIYDKHKDYIILPSSCKVSHIKYEFTFVKSNCLPITCQVKNQKELPDIDYYVDDKEVYEKIYLFSGLWSDEDVEKKQMKYNGDKYSHLQFIKPSELFETLKTSNVVYNDRYYQLDVSNHLFCMDKLEKNKEWKKCTQFRGNNLRRYKINSENHYIYFINNYIVKYDEQFHALILFDRKQANEDLLQEIIDILT